MLSTAFTVLLTGWFFWACHGWFADGNRCSHSHGREIGPRRLLAHLYLPRSSLDPPRPILHISCSTTTTWLMIVLFYVQWHGHYNKINSYSFIISLMFLFANSPQNISNIKHQFRTSTFSLFLEEHVRTGRAKSQQEHLIKWRRTNVIRNSGYRKRNVCVTMVFFPKVYTSSYIDLVLPYFHLWFIAIGY